jgi:hypothetical protein
LNGVQSVRTVYIDDTLDPNNARIINGISMASWSDRFILTDGYYPLDMDVGNISRQLE